MIDYDGKYLLITPDMRDENRLVSYGGGNDSRAWLRWCYRLVSPKSELIDIVSATNPALPPFFDKVDLIVDDEGLLQDKVMPNPVASFLYDGTLVGSVLVGYVHESPDGEGYHVFPISEHPQFDRILDFFHWMEPMFGRLVE